MSDLTREEEYLPEWAEKVRKIGRVFVYNQVLWLSYSGTGIEWECADGFRMTVVSDSLPKNAEGAGAHYARYALFMDGALYLDERLDEDRREISFEEEGRHSYRFIKLSESADSSMGIESLEGISGGIATFEPIPDRKLKIEIIGDSITCGYGVEGDLTRTYSTADENVTKSYSYLVAQKLDADYSIVSKSGAGMVSGYTDDGNRRTDNILTDYYDKMGCSMFRIGDAFPSDFEYDFSFEPDIIILNAGTNDISYCTPMEPSVRARFTEEDLKARNREFCDAYKKFLEHLRDRNPFAKIICTLGIMGEELNNTVQMAVSMQVAEGDRRVWWLPLEDQLAEDGYGTDYHPSVLTQEKLAARVTDFVEKVLRKEV